jgi:hypothetical protein
MHSLCVCVCMCAVCICLFRARHWMLAIVLIVTMLRRIHSILTTLSTENTCVLNEVLVSLQLRGRELSWYCRVPAGGTR